jgi:O-methyltransferase
MNVTIIKRGILWLVQRAGYVITKVADNDQREQLFRTVEADLQQRAEVASRLESANEGLREDLDQERNRTLVAVQKLAEADREFRLARERDRRELETARAETWEFREQAADLQRKWDSLHQERGELTNRLNQSLDDNRRLKIRVEEVPQIDYQVLMREQHERAAFQDADPGFAALYERVKGFSMTSIERLYAMYKATEYLCRAGVPGSIVECGVWRGGSMMMAALTLQALGDTSRELYLFDTYEGLPKPNRSEDIDLWGHSAYNEWTRHRRTDESSDWAAASLEEVQANLASTGYPSDKLILVKGMVQKTLPTIAVDRIALLRLDTDWFESTVCELEYLYPRLTHNGILIIDDYGHMRGQRKAVDEYFARNGLCILLNRIDYSGRIGVKPALDSLMAHSVTPPAVSVAKPAELTSRLLR